MAKIKLFGNSRDPGLSELVEKMRKAGIDFSSIPTSGPSVLWVDDRTCYGITAVAHSIRALLSEKHSLENIEVGPPFAVVQNIC